jgi:hypothetical protein
MAYKSTIGGNSQQFVGEDKEYAFAVYDSDGDRVDISGWVIKFDVRTSVKADAPVVPTQVCVIEGAYNVDETQNTQYAVATFTDDQLALFSAKTYQWSAKRDEAGVETILGHGDFDVERATQV